MQIRPEKEKLFLDSWYFKLTGTPLHCFLLLSEYVLVVNFKGVANGKLLLACSWL